MGEFGDKFRKEREKKKFSLDDVSNVTKIGSRMLQAIEEENFDRLPGGVFNKGFIRAYAKHLGMNDEEAVTAYLACQRQAQIAAHEAWEPASSTQNRPSPEKRSAATSNKTSRKASANKTSSKVPVIKAKTQSQDDELPELQLPRAEHVRPPRKKYLDQPDRGIPIRLIAVAGVVLVLLVVLWIRHPRSPRTEAANVPPALTTATQTPAPVPPSSQNPASNQPAASNPLVANAQQSSSAQPASARPTAAVSAPAAKNDGTLTTSPLQSAAASAKPAATLTLVIRASENSWISVQADGQSVSAETLIAPAHTSVRAAREIVVKTGNAAGVSFLWNGKEIPAEGVEAEVKTYVFDANGVRTSPAAQPSAQN